MSTNLPADKPEPENSQLDPTLRPRLIQFQRILVPIDFSEFSRQAIEFAQGLARQFAGSITLVHVVEPIYSYPADGIMSYPGELHDPNLDLLPAAKKSMKRLAEIAAQTGHTPVQGEVRVGRAFDEIARFARELPADVIVIASHGYTGLKHVFLGSTAERVVRHAPCPVLVVRSTEETSRA